MSPVHLGGRFTDAGARRPGNRLQPGLSGFDSHRRLFVMAMASIEGKRLIVSGQRRIRLRRTAVGLVCSVHGF